MRLLDADVGDVLRRRCDDGRWLTVRVESMRDDRKLATYSVVDGDSAERMTATPSQDDTRDSRSAVSSAWERV